MSTSNASSSLFGRPMLALYGISLCRVSQIGVILVVLRGRLAYPSLAPKPAPGLGGGA